MPDVYPLLHTITAQSRKSTSRVLIETYNNYCVKLYSIKRNAHGVISGGRVVRIWVNTMRFDVGALGANLVHGNHRSCLVYNDTL